MTKATIGEVITGTLRFEDLIPAFVYELQRIADPNDNDAFALINAANGLEMVDDYYTEQDVASDIVLDLIDALNRYAPPRCVFDALEGDGSCFGFWPDFEWLNGYNDDGETLRVDDLSAIPDDYNGEALVINDHGNASFYSVTNGKSQLIWTIV